MKISNYVLNTLLFAIIGIISFMVFGLEPAAGAAVFQLAHFSNVPFGALAINAAAGKTVPLSVKLKSELSEITEKQRGYLDSITGDKTALTEAEQKDYNTLEQRALALETQLNNAIAVEKREANFGGKAPIVITAGLGDDMKRAGAGYSLMRAIQSTLSGKRDGLELEMHQEGIKEYRAAGIDYTEGQGIIMPLSMMRAMSVTGDGTQGGFLVQKELTFIDALRETLATTQAGANFLTGLVGDVGVNKGSTFSLAWATENGAATQVEKTIAQAVMSPKRITGYGLISRRLIAQSSIDVENMFRMDLMRAVAELLDAAAITGTGLNNQPTGLLTAANVATVALGADGAAPTWANILALKAALGTKEFVSPRWAHLVNGITEAYLKSKSKDAGSGNFIMSEMDVINGKKTVVTDHLPSNLTKGNGTGLSALVFGDFSNLYIGSWAGLEILADPYTAAGTNQLKLVVNAHNDVLVARPEAFAKIIDADC